MARHQQQDLYFVSSSGDALDRLRYEREAWKDGFHLVAGVDEAGRGPLAGPVVAATVILDAHRPIKGLDDSKRLSAAKRDQLFEKIRRRAAGLGVGIVNQNHIDRLNILNATLEAMRRAVLRVTPCPDFLLIDGTSRIPLDAAQKTIVGGDRKSLSISAASIVAKVIRDRRMLYYDKKFPYYNFKSNKGYGTMEHRQAIARYGCCPIHRKTFRGVKEFMETPPLFARS